MAVTHFLPRVVSLCILLSGDWYIVFFLEFLVSPRCKMDCGWLAFVFFSLFLVVIKIDWVKSFYDCV